MSSEAKSETAPTPAAEPPAPTPAAEAPLQAADLEPYKPPPGDLYFVQLWQSALVLVVAVLLHLPFLLDGAFTHTFPVHASGAVVVTGASPGSIGHDVALTLAGRGYTVYATVRTADQIKALKAEDKANIIPLQLDIAKEGNIERVAKEITKQVEAAGQPLVALINNAGTHKHSPVEFHEMKDVRSIFEVNVFGTVKMVQKLLPLLRASQGRVINISSVLGKLAIADSGAYAASKHALEAFSDALRRELQPLNVSVSVVEPGLVKTPQLERLMEDWKKASAEVKGVYRHLYSDLRAADKARHHAKASPASSVSRVVLDAITSPTPQPRYAVANVDDWPGSFITWAARIFPDRVLDHLLIREYTHK